MKEFNYLDYHTEYSSTGHTNKRMSTNACFGYVFNNTNTCEPISCKYRIILYRTIDFMVNNHLSNYCIFNSTKLRNHLKQAQGICPFTFNIRRLNNWKQKYKVYEVILDLQDAPGTFHKYILSWLRYTYEFPYNMFLLDAYRLKKETCFRFRPISDIFNLVLECYCEDLRTVHQIPENYISVFMSKKNILSKLTSIQVLNGLYNRAKNSVIKSKVIPSKVGKYSTNDLEYWTNEDIYNERRAIYIDIYQKFLRKK